MKKLQVEQGADESRGNRSGKDYSGCTITLSTIVRAFLSRSAGTGRNRFARRRFGRTRSCAA